MKSTDKNFALALDLMAVQKECNALKKERDELLKRVRLLESLIELKGQQVDALVMVSESASSSTQG